MEKKQYIAPMTEVIKMDAVGVFCGSSGAQKEVLEIETDPETDPDPDESGSGSPTTDGSGWWIGD